MWSNLHSTVIQFIILGLLHMSISFCQDVERFRRCSEPILCGNIGVNHPFWGGGRPEYCGRPSFEINCESNIPNIAIESTTYKVITHNRILTLARDDLLSNICLDNPENASLDLNIFSFVSTDQNITLYYGCTFSGSQVPTVRPNVFICASNISGFGPSYIFGIYTMIGVSFDFSTVRCEKEIIVRVNQTSAAALASATATFEVLKTAISGGFSVNWTANIDSLCEQCDNSGGRCGSNPDSAAFACHCATDTHAFNCTAAENQDGDNLFSPLFPHDFTKFDGLL